MRRVIGGALAILLSVAVATAAWADCAGEQSTRAQMKCCAATHHQCRNRRNPEDCCKQMRDAGPSAALSTAAVPSITVPVHGIVHLLPAPASRVAAGRRPLASPDFTRPHDPPHLHPFALLI